MNAKTMKKWLLLPLLALMAFTANANNGFNFDEYVVYYNAFTADNLPAEMTKSYGITRSKSRGVLNISVQRKGAPGKLSLPVSAQLKVTLKNLVGQQKDLTLRLIKEGDAIYYIGDFRVSHKELITFNIEALPEGTTKPLEFSFKQQFDTN